MTSTHNTPWPIAPKMADSDEWEGTQLIAQVVNIVVGNSVKLVKINPVVLLDTKKIDELTATRKVSTYTGHHEEVKKAWRQTPTCPTCQTLLAYRYTICASTTHIVHVRPKKTWTCLHCKKDIDTTDVQWQNLSSHEFIEYLKKFEEKNPLFVS